MSLAIASSQCCHSLSICSENDSESPLDHACPADMQFVGQLVRPLKEILFHAYRDDSHTLPTPGPARFSLRSLPAVLSRLGHGLERIDDHFLPVGCRCLGEL